MIIVLQQYIHARTNGCCAKKKLWKFRKKNESFHFKIALNSLNQAIVSDEKKVVKHCWTKDAGKIL